MRTTAKIAACPVCGRAATLTLTENVDPIAGTEGHSIEFECADPRHQLDETQKLRLWVADRVGDAFQD